MTSTSSLDDLDLALSQASEEYAAPKASTPVRRPGVARQPLRRSSPKRDDDPPFVDVEHALGTLLAERILGIVPDLADALRHGAPVVVIEVPARDLIEPVHSGLSERFSTTAEADVGSARWKIIHGGDSLRRREHDTAKADLRQAVLDGRPVIAISHLPERNLLPDILRIADIRITVPPLDAAFIRRLAEFVTRTSLTSAAPEQVPSNISVDDMAFAARRGQDADAYLARLLQLLSRRTKAPTLRLEDLSGMDEVVAWGTALARDLADYKAGRLSWGEIDRGVLLHGPPGTGKTTAAKAIAGTCGLPLITASFARWQAAGHLGDMLKAMITTFDEARASAPAILFIDELDSVGDRATFQGNNVDYSTQVLNAFLELLDGVSARAGVVVVGATNNRNRIDPAIRRPGRLDREIHVGLPDRAALAKILRYHLREDLAGEDLDGVALLGLGATGAQAEQWVRDARRVARHARRPMTLADLVQAVAAKREKMSPEHRRRIAIHEAGHAVVATLLRPGSVVKMTLTPNGRAQGGVLMADADAPFVTLKDVEERLCDLLAGHAAEEVILGRASSGSGGSPDSDLGLATLWAVNALANLGMRSGRQRLLWRDVSTVHRLQDALKHDPDLARDVSQLLEGAHARATDIVRQHRGTVEALADALLALEVLDATQVEVIVHR